MPLKRAYGVSETSALEDRSLAIGLTFSVGLLLIIASDFCGRPQLKYVAPQHCTMGRLWPMFDGQFSQLRALPRG